MSCEIWKFPIEVAGMQKVAMPLGARILSVDMQRGVLCLWAMVDTRGEASQRLIEIHGTGEPIKTGRGDSRQFIGTVQVGQFVWHVFEYVPLEEPAR